MVGPDWARKMAKEVDAIRLHLTRMSKELREAAAQASWSHDKEPQRNRGY
jgi:hypothetical protein